MPTDKNNKISPIVRYAPSPTGLLHLGNARTALYNWIFARSMKGKIILRIEDTDKERSQKKYSDEIIKDLKWLGIDFDGEIVWQGENIQRHQQVVQHLLDNNLAYKCYATPKELDILRNKARSSGHPFIFDPKWRNLDHLDHKETESRTSFVVRLKVAREQENYKISDIVQGDLNSKLSQIDDFVLLRSDGTPTYMLSVVVDDHDMGITHVIRGADHITNAFRQSQLYLAMNWDIPTFAHLPLLHTPDGKMSKRVNQASTNDTDSSDKSDTPKQANLQTLEYYRSHGYLPEALRNALLRLGWGSADHEYIDDEQALSLFKLNDVGRSPSQFDIAKLNSLNNHYMKKIDTKVIWQYWKEYFPKQVQEQYQESLIEIAPLMFERHNTLEEAAEAVTFVYQKVEYPIKEPKANKVFTDIDLEVLETWFDIFLTEDDCITTIKNQVEGKDFGKAMRILRVVLTGTMQSPDLRSVVNIFGREECLDRIRSGIENKPTC